MSNGLLSVPSPAPPELDAEKRIAYTWGMNLTSMVNNRIDAVYSGKDREFAMIARILFLVSVILCFVSVTVALVIRMDGYGRILLWALFAGMAVIAGLVLTGKARVSSILVSLVLSVLLSSLTFMLPAYRGFMEFYMVGFLNLFAMGVTIVIAYWSWQVFFIAGTASIAVVLNLVLRHLPAVGFSGEVPQYDDAFIVILLVNLVAVSMNGVMKRTRRFLSQANEAASQSERQNRILRGAMEASSAAFTRGSQLAESASRTSALTGESKSIVGRAESSMKELSDDSRLLDEEITLIGMSSAKARESAEGQSSVINETSAAIEEMTASIMNINTVTRERKGAVRELSKSTEDGSRIVAESARSMGEVESSTGAILEVIKVISAVAAQTNLLAMNAAIEAAHAGEAGRGFAVVADEIRKLSEQTSKSVKAVTDTVKGTIRDIRMAAEGNEKAVVSFATIAKEAELVSGAMDEIIDGLEELSKGTDEINRGVADSVTSTNTLREAVADLDAQIASAKVSLDALKVAAEKVGGDLSNVVVTIDSIAVEANRVDEIGQANANGLGTLKAALDEAGI